MKFSQVSIDLELHWFSQVGWALTMISSSRQNKVWWLANLRRCQGRPVEISSGRRGVRYDIATIVTIMPG